MLCLLHINRQLVLLVRLVGDLVLNHQLKGLSGSGSAPNSYAFKIWVLLANLPLPSHHLIRVWSKIVYSTDIWFCYTPAKGDLTSQKKK